MKKKNVEIKESVEEAFRNHPDVKSARGYIVKCMDDYMDKWIGIEEASEYQWYGGWQYELKKSNNDIYWLIIKDQDKIEI